MDAPFPTRESLLAQDQRVVISGIRIGNDLRTMGRLGVTVVDVDMPFKSMVVFMVKWALAAIPAFLILAVLGFILSAMFAGIGSGILGK